MGDKSKIEWTDATVNAIRARNTTTQQIGWHCEHISEGCRNCYAEKRNRGFFNLGTRRPYEPVELNSGRVEVFLDEKALRTVLGWKKPRRIFWCSMTDIFGRFVPDEWLDQILAVCALTPQHQHIFLTKRPERPREYLNDPGTRERIDACITELAFEHTDPHDRRRDDLRATAPDVQDDANWPLPNVIGMVSVENQATANERIPIHLQTPWALRSVSYEPALGPVDFRLTRRPTHDDYRGWHGDGPIDVVITKQGQGINLIIVGGESGPGARPFDIQWARDVIAQCRAANVPVFVKQIGAKPIATAHTRDGEPTNAVIEYYPPKNRKGGDMAEWPEDLRVREMPALLTMGK